MPPFRRPLTIRFDEADPCGILFFGRIFEVVHRVFEDFVISALGIGWNEWFLAEQMMVPIKHAEATYFQPLLPGHEYRAELLLVGIGESSFEVATRILAGADEPGQLCVETRVVHVFTDARLHGKSPIPSELRARLEACLARQ